MTAHEWCVRIRRAAERGGAASDDSRLSLRYIYAILNTYRNSNIRIATDFGKITSLLKYAEQDYGEARLCSVDKAETSNYLWGCKVLKVCSLPRFLSLPEHRAIRYVGPLDRSQPFLYAEPTDIAVKRKLSKRFSYYYIKGDNLYVVPSEALSNIEVIDIQAVFVDPSEVDDRINPNVDIPGNEVDYPMINSNEDDVMRFALNELGFTLQTRADELNNRRDDT